MLHNFILKVVLEVHSDQDLPPQLVLCFVLTTAQHLSGTLSIHFGSLLFQFSDGFLFLFGFVVKK